MKVRQKFQRKKSRKHEDSHVGYGLGEENVPVDRKAVSVVARDVRRFERSWI